MPFVKMGYLSLMSIIRDQPTFSNRATSGYRSRGFDHRQPHLTPVATFFFFFAWPSRKSGFDAPVWKTFFPLQPVRAEPAPHDSRWIYKWEGLSTGKNLFRDVRDGRGPLRWVTGFSDEILTTWRAPCYP